MRRAIRQAIRALLAGSLAFGLIAAAASGATFGLTVQDIVRIGTSEASAELVVEFAGCEGTYHIEWQMDGDDISGFTATRADDDEDDPLCANQSFRLLLSAFIDEDTWSALVAVPTLEDETDADGNITATFVEPFDPGDRDEIVLVIGPGAATLYDL